MAAHNLQQAATLNITFASIHDRSSLGKVQTASVSKCRHEAGLDLC